MFKTALIAAAVMAVAAPAFAAKASHKADAAAEATSGPIPYSDLAAADAKLNGGGPRKHTAKTSAKPAEAPAAAPAQ
jgi:hypothetical protein